MGYKWRPGSAGEQEQKEARIIGVFVSVISLLCLALIFFIPSQYRDAVKETSTALNYIGAVLVLGSIVPVIIATKAGEEGAEGYAKWWALSLALGLFLAACQGL